MSSSITRLTLAASAALLLAGAAFAAFAADAPAASDMGKPVAPHVKKTLQILTPDQVDPARILPAPVADGSAQQIDQLVEVERIYRSRTPERYAQAKWDDGHENSMIFAATLGDRFDLTKLPATARLLAIVENDQAVSATIAKTYFKRTRPWAIDTSIIPCDYKPGAATQTSYPSGHATLGYSVGLVLSTLMPEKSQAIMARAQDYAYSREVCGDHYASDTEASHALGTVIALDLLASPKLAADIEASRKELAAAGLTAAH